MALQSVDQMVKDMLPYLNNVSFTPVIERNRIVVVYLMQSQTGKNDVEVEAESNYTGIQNILFSKMTVYEMIKSKSIQTLGGDGTTGSSGGSKILKRAKADVTEAEFVVVKSADGSLIQMSVTDYMTLLVTEVCALARSLSYTVYYCTCEADIIPPFIIGCDYPPAPKTIGDILTGLPIG
jgi:hypothetical protein